MTKKISLYAVLRIASDAPEEEIRLAYTRHIKNLKVIHADDDEKLKDQVGVANIALEVLTDPVRRQKHDIQLGLDPSKNSALSSAHQLFTEDRRTNTSDKSTQRKFVSGGRPPLLLRPFFWVWQVLWSVLGPILTIGIRLGVIAGLVWLIFFARFTSEYRLIASNWFREAFPPAYDSLRCEKARLKVAEAERIKKRYEDRLNVKDGLAAGYVIGKLLTGDVRGATQGAAEAKRLTQKERYELEQADAVLKSKVINDLECFRKP